MVVWGALKTAFLHKVCLTKFFPTSKSMAFLGIFPKLHVAVFLPETCLGHFPRNPPKISNRRGFFGIIFLGAGPYQKTRCLAMCCAWLLASPCKHIGACKTPMAGMVMGHSKPGLLMAALPCSNSMIELLPRCNATQHSTCIGKLVNASCPFQISRQQDVLVGQQSHPLWGLSPQPQR